MNNNTNYRKIPPLNTDALNQPRREKIRLIFISIGVLLLIGLLIHLGLWQLRRAAEKRTLESAFQSQSLQKPRTNLTNITANDNYLPILISGHFQNQYTWLLDNKIYKGNVGYQVVRPFVTTTGTWLLVNLGWVKAPPNRNELPTLAVIQGAQTLSGLIYFPQEVLTLSHIEERDTHWPKRLQTLNLNKMSKDTPQPLLPFVFLLSPKAPVGYIRNWQPVATPAEKNTAYAVQWFALAATLAMLYIVFLWKLKTHDNSNKN